MFISDEAELAYLLFTILIVIMVMNIRFFLYWMMHFLLTIDKKHDLYRTLFVIITFLACKRAAARQLTRHHNSALVSVYDNESVRIEVSYLNLLIWNLDPSEYSEEVQERD